MSLDSLELDEHLEWILGRPNFWCASMANRLREKGHDIEFKSENEQAAAIHFMLNLYLEHGADWKSKANDYLKLEQ